MVNGGGPGARTVLRFGVMAVVLVEQFDLGFAFGGLLDVVAELLNGLLGTPILFFEGLEGSDVVPAAQVSKRSAQQPRK